MIDNSGLKLTFWIEAIRHAADLHNKTMMVELGFRTLVETSVGTTPNNLESRIFGCTVFTHTDKVIGRNKFQDRANTEVYLGIENGLHHICLLEIRNVVTTNHVCYYENDLQTRGPVENTVQYVTQQEINSHPQEKEEEEEEEPVVYVEGDIKTAMGNKETSDVSDSMADEERNRASLE